MAHLLKKVPGIFLFHQSCSMFLLIHSLKNGSLKDTVSPSISMKSLAINAFLIPCTLAEISRRYSFCTGWACFFLRYLQQWFFSFTYLAFLLGRYDWFLLGLCRNFTRLSLGFGVSWNLQLRCLGYFVGKVYICSSKPWNGVLNSCCFTLEWCIY